MSIDLRSDFYDAVLGRWTASLGLLFPYVGLVDNVKVFAGKGARLHVYAGIDWRSAAAAPAKLENGLYAWFQVMARRAFRLKYGISLAAYPSFPEPPSHSVAY